MPISRHTLLSLYEQLTNYLWHGNVVVVERRIPTCHLTDSPYAKLPLLLAALFTWISHWSTSKEVHKDTDVAEHTEARTLICRAVPLKLHKRLVARQLPIHRKACRMLSMTCAGAIFRLRLQRSRFDPMLLIVSWIMTSSVLIDPSGRVIWMLTNVQTCVHHRLKDFHSLRRFINVPVFVTLLCHCAHGIALNLDQTNV